MNFKGVIISSNNKLHSGVFNMLESEKPVPMSSKGAIAFKGFGTLQDKYNNWGIIVRSYIAESRGG